MKLKNEVKGITLIAMAITITIILLVLGGLAYQSSNYSKVKKLKNMYADIQVLSNKVSSFYDHYGKLPVLIQYDAADQMKDSINPNDNDIYYVLDISALENVKLSYGNDFKKIKENQQVTEETDIYIINEQSHTIYYPKGIRVDGVSYYRDYQEYQKVE